MVAFHQFIKNSSEHCPRCGSAKSSWLDGNCPLCLIRLSGLAGPCEETEAGGPTSLALPWLGEYQLLEEIARGGMGVVYRARQATLNREVALKVLPGGRFANENFIRRFRREAEALASLHHPNIVAIHEVGEYEGQLYFSMDLIAGCSLAECIHNPFPVRKAAQLVQRIAEAMTSAHERRLLHRDLKPSNILLDDQGAPHITDFGLAKRSDDESDLTLTGEILGSPNYMAPEQADPRLGSASPASDVYSIGAILYHLLTGRPPFMADSIAQTLRLLAEGRPVSPRLLRRGLSRDLETICLKCLETNPALRYQSAKKLADELDRFQRNEPIRARPVGLVAKLVRWCRCKPALASTAGVVALLLLVLAIGSPIALFRIQRERELSEAARKREFASRLLAEAAEREARRQLYAALLQQAHASVHSGEVGQRLQALDAIRRAAAISNSLDLRREAIAALTLPDLRLEHQWPAGPEFTLRQLDPAFERVALCRGSGPVELRDTSDWRLLAHLSPSTNLPAYAAWWSRDRRFLAVKRDQSREGDRGKLEVWETARQQCVIPLLDIVKQAVSFHPRLPRLMFGQAGGSVATWDLEKGLQVARLPLPGMPTQLEFSPDGERFAVALEQPGKVLVTIHDATTGTIQATHVFAEPILNLDWHPSGRWVAVADQRGTVHRMDSQTGQTQKFGSHQAQAVRVVFTPDGNYLFSGGWERELICWDTRTMQRCLTARRQGWDAQFRSDGLQCALLTTSGIELHTFVRPNHREFFEDLGPRLRRAVFSPDGRWLAAAADQHLGVWDLSGSSPGAVTAEIDGAHPSFVNQGAELLAMGSDNRGGHWRLIPGTNPAAPPVLQSLGSPPPIGWGAFAFVSNAIVCRGATGSATVYREGLAATQPAWIRAVHGVSGMSADNLWFGIGQPFSPLLEIYRLPDMKQVTTIRSRGNIADFAFAPAGDELTVGTSAGVEFWSTEGWTQTRVLTNFTSVLFTPKGSAWWLTAASGTAGLYDTRTLEPLLPLPTGTLPLALSPDGRFLAVRVEFRYLQLWDLEDVRRHLRELGLDWHS